LLSCKVRALYQMSEIFQIYSIGLGSLFFDLRLEWLRAMNLSGESVLGNALESARSKIKDKDQRPI